MLTLVTDPQLSASLIQDRQSRGIDHHDEVWEGVYVMSPAPNNEHQDLVGGFIYLLRTVIDQSNLGKVLPGTNITDQTEDWTKNYRCPDVVFFSSDTQAIDRDTHWLGGPDLAIEIVSPGDQTREKIAFYEKVRTRELLIVDRDPWQLELFRFMGDRLTSVGFSRLPESAWLTSKSVPLQLRLLPGLLPGKQRPQIELQHTSDEKTWRL